MKKNYLFFIVFLYYLITSIFFFWKIDSFIKDIFIAPLFYLIPTGIGLLILSLFKTHEKFLSFMTRMQLILCASFLGFVFIPLFYISIGNEKLTGLFCFLYPLLNLLSLHGFYNTMGILYFKNVSKYYLNIFVTLFLVYLPVYYFHFMHFSRFPLRDLYQDIHFMKGAMELSKYYFLNLSTAHTYLPLIQVHTGLLNHFYGCDLINLHWILPLFSFFFHSLCLYCFYNVFIKDRYNLMLILVFSTIFLDFFTISNYQFTISLSLVLFSVLTYKNRSQVSLLPIIVELSIFFLAAIFLYLNRSFPVQDHTFLPFLLSILLLIFLISLFDIRRFLPVLCVILIVSLAVPLHKGMILTVPTIFLLYIIYFISTQWQYPGSFQLKYELSKKSTKYIAISLPAALLFAIMVERTWPSVGSYIINSLYPVYLALGGDGDYSYIGPIGILAEWFRKVPPAFHFLLLLLTVDFLIKYKRSKIRSEDIFEEVRDGHIIFYVLSVFVLFLTCFIPLPHLYRVYSLTVMMLFPLAVVLLNINGSRNSDSRCRSTAIPCTLIGLALYTIIAQYLYNMPWKYELTISPYISMVFPIFAIGIVIIFFSYISLKLVHNPTSARILTTIIIVSALYVDKINITSKLYENSFGPVLPESEIISHYSLLELKVARHLNNTLNSKEFILMSDPYTLSIFQAITGNNGFYSFSNIGVMKKEYEMELKAILHIIFPREDKDYGKNIISTTMKNTSFNNIHKHVHYGQKNMYIMNLLHKYIETYPGACFEAIRASPAVMNKLDSELMKKNIIWIVNEKTLAWAYGEVGYFPQNNPLTTQYIRQYVDPQFKTMLNVDNQILILCLR